MHCLDLQGSKQRLFRCDGNASQSRDAEQGKETMLVAIVVGVHDPNTSLTLNAIGETKLSGSRQEEVKTRS